MAKEVKKDNRTYHIVLENPVTYNGEEITELEFDFSKPTGADCSNIEDELQAMGKVALVETASGPYLIRFAAKACTTPIGADFFDYVSAVDYISIKGRARSFLLRLV